MKFAMANFTPTVIFARENKNETVLLKNPKQIETRCPKNGSFFLLTFAIPRRKSRVMP